MTVVKLVNATGMRMHVSCMNIVLVPGGAFSICESELERNYELMKCVNAGHLSKEEIISEIAQDVVNLPDDTEEPTTEELVAEVEVPVSDVDEEIDIEERLGIRISEADKSGNVDGKAYIRYNNAVIEVDPFTAQVGKEESSDDSEGDGKRYVDGLEILGTPKNEKTVSIDGIDMVIDETDEKDEYGPQFIESE